MKIIAVGKNYRDHAIEFDGTSEKPDAPIIFMKPDSAILKNPRPFFVPDFMGRIEYEAEIVASLANFADYVAAQTLAVSVVAAPMAEAADAPEVEWNEGVIRIAVSRV
jgi:2-keto-4-pentenoate hydratase/2-oxohepta-3-ene-1,7-dioic acid hydratase in catechol pathway